jgi:hypothetical protein
MEKGYDLKYKELKAQIEKEYTENKRNAISSSFGASILGPTQQPHLGRVPQTLRR